MELDLGDRKGLPEPLRFLVNRHPREIWRDHPNFDGLTAFWLSRHLEFRRALGIMQDMVEQVADKRIEEEKGAMQLLRVAQFLVQSLEGHHHIEDTEYFPIFTRTEPRLSAGFELLDRDHMILHEELDGLDRSATHIVRALQMEDSPRDAVARMGKRLGRFAPFLDRHLLDEEDLVVPVILEYGTPHI